MATAVAHPSPTYAPRLKASVERLRRALLWLMVASSSIVLIEPAPYDGMFMFASVVFILTGLRFSTRVVPLLLLVTLFNIGGAFSLIPFLSEQPSVMFVVVSFYLGFSAVIFANLVIDNTEQRLEIIRGAWVVAGVVASVCGVMGYFGIAGTSELFTRYGRATGTFKDPNVFGPFVAVPIVLIIQGLMSGTLKRPILSLGALVILLAGVFFSFSRGAWGVTIFATVMTGALLFVTTPSNRTRTRIVILAILGAAALVLALAAILSIDSVREIFEMRASLSQDYDVGSRGRFGKLLDAIPMLIERPNGFGPLHFTDFFPEAPHNVYVNAFSAYGWLGGLAYLCLIAATVRLGWSSVWRRTPWQGPLIAFWSITFWQILQGLQIDTDHWRHLWLLIGLTWGLAIASRRYAIAKVTPAPAPAWMPKRAAATSAR